MGLIGTWIGVVTKPEETFRAEKPKASVGGGILNNLIIAFIDGIYFGALLTLFAFVFPEFNSLFALLGIAPDIVFLLVWVGAVIVYPMVVVLGSLVGAFILFVFAKIFGGKGSFSQQYYLVSLYAVPIGLASLAIAILENIPILGFLFGGVSILVSIYSLYLLTLALREAHSYDTTAAFLTWLVPSLIIGAIFFILFFLIILSILGTLPSADYGRYAFAVLPAL